MVFKEGEWYNFRIINQIDIPDKGNQFVLQHSSGRRILLPADNYVKYNLVIGSIIDCRVDKINCTGQIYMEPKHPYYAIGDVYPFKILSINDKDKLIEVEDILGEKIEVFSNNFINRNIDEIPLKVISIKKGKPQLAIPSLNINNIVDIDLNSSVLAYVDDMVTVYNESYYKLSILSKHIGLLKVKHYSCYGFNVGDNLECKYIGTYPDGTLKLEPINPNYYLDEIYQFKIEDFEEIAGIEEDSVIIAEVLDVNQKKCGVKLPDSNYSKGQIINCKVVGYRKGRPQLEIVL
ncbi:MAG: hypothetical protein AB7S48_01525 [Bacteroidales bacterium]